jgi:riboflavin biosynthesis pyrimidine reductase
MDFRQLLPEPQTVAVDALLSSLRSSCRVPVDRPYTLVNFIATADGRATLGGRSGPLGDDGDRAMFGGLREQADAVLVGTGTLRAERYGRILGRAERRGRRADRGLSPEPIACVVTRSGDVPTDVPLFAEPDTRVVIFSPVAVDLTAVEAQVTVVALDPGERALTAALRHLRTEYGVELLLCEGGPTLFGALLLEGVADELFLTVAPKLAGGGAAPTISQGAELTSPGELRVRWALERDESIYLRYAVVKTGDD